MCGQLESIGMFKRVIADFLMAENKQHVMLVAFLDQRGLRSPWRSVRVRCAYLITPLIKSHRKTLVPHTEQLLAQFADLLQLPCEPDPSINIPHCGSCKVGDQLKHDNPPGPLLSVTETSFLYEAAAQLIAAGGTVSTPVVTTNEVGTVEDRAGHLFRMLLAPVFAQYGQLVELYVSESDPKTAEARGRLTKQAADLITRTSRVFSQPKSVLTPTCQAVLCEALQIMLTGLTRFPSEAWAPGRAAACAGVRAFLHRMVACLGPSSPTEQPSDSNHVSEILLAALIQAVPQLVRPLQVHHRLNGWANGGVLPNVADAEQRWHEIRDVIPLITQVILRYKPLSSILAQVEACIDADDPLGLRSGLLLFLQLIQLNANDNQFYENFLLSQLVPFCVVAPTRPNFRLTDAQFGLALNEVGNCLFVLAQKQPGLCSFLQNVFLPGQQLSNDLIQSYVGTLKAHNVKDFCTFLRGLCDSADSLEAGDAKTSTRFVSRPEY
ncbi:unnamed protein product [Echinostoma caproni]|uniref:Exportin-T n=1 Tax=Echinostoma caproni TaxID=27848 RepID=A0A3P8HXS6_9TREM|nr:unnamed protein product [Echinostoma caproni]